MDEIDVKDCVLKLECSDQGSDADLHDGELAQLDDISKIVSADSELRVTSSPQFTKCSTQFTKMEDKLEIMNQKLDKILSNCHLWLSKQGHIHSFCDDDII